MSDTTGNQDQSFEQLRLKYLRFAENEAKDVSPLYQELAQAVADSATMLRFIASLPTPKQQPNLVFAAVRRLFGTPADAQQFAQVIVRHQHAIRELILVRTTQTNEPSRCAVLLPLLSQLPQPLALLEVGASAGLCLLPDRWGYDYGRVQIEPNISKTYGAPTFPCIVNDATPLPKHVPDIVWRVGLDVNPINLTDPEEVAWLETLVWPGQEARAERLRAAIRVAQEEPPPIIKGDLLTDLQTLAVSAPRNATLVVFHSAVLAYVTQEARHQFINTVTNLDAVWISNEAPGVLPSITAKLSQEPPQNKFVLAKNGEPVAFTGPHGQSIEWL